MKNYNPSLVREAISKTRDGKLVGKDIFTAFIVECIDRNTEGYSANNSREVNVTDLIDYFKYMIDQLILANAALTKLDK